MNSIKIWKWTFSKKKTRVFSKVFPLASGESNKNFTGIFAPVAAILLAGLLFVQPAAAGGGMDPESEKILRAMSDFMGKLSAFSATADVDNEIVDRDGQKLQFSSTAKIVMQRPDHFHVSRQGGIIHLDFIFDGKVLTLHGRNKNVYFQKDTPGTTDTAIDTLHDAVGLDTPGADLLYSDAYSILSEGVSSSAYMGTSYVNGVECHYLAFREPQVDWQLWIKAEGDPLPMKYVIVTKWMTGAPQYSVRFRDWNLSPKIDPGQFDFKPPEGSKKLEDILVDNMGELVLEEVEK